jgi:hypothetical protein
MKELNIPYDLSTIKGKYWMVVQLINKFSKYVLKQEVGVLHSDVKGREDGPKLYIAFNNTLKSEFQDLLHSPPECKLEEQIGKFEVMDDYERFIYTMDCLWYYCDSRMTVTITNLEDLELGELKIPNSSFGALFFINRTAWGLENWDVFKDVEENCR